MVAPRVRDLSILSHSCTHVHILRQKKICRRNAYIYFVLNSGATVKLGILMETREQLLAESSARLCLCLKLIRIFVFVPCTPQRGGLNATYRHMPQEVREEFSQT
jgi:hypothetical protein